MLEKGSPRLQAPRSTNDTKRAIPGCLWRDNDEHSSHRLQIHFHWRPLRAIDIHGLLRLDFLLKGLEKENARLLDSYISRYNGRGAGKGRWPVVSPNASPVVKSLFDRRAEVARRAFPPGVPF
jgi:hypothetical protein